MPSVSREIVLEAKAKPDQLIAVGQRIQSVLCMSCPRDAFSYD